MAFINWYGGLHSSWGGSVSKIYIIRVNHEFIIKSNVKWLASLGVGGRLGDFR